MDSEHKLSYKWALRILVFVIGISAIGFAIRAVKIKKLENVIANLNMNDTANAVVVLDSIYKTLESDTMDSAFGPMRDQVKLKLIALGKDTSYFKPKFVSIEHIMKSRLSDWDGSLKPLVAVVKNAMHYPNSFVHTHTSYEKSKTDSTDFLIVMSYRSKSALGFKMRNEIKCIYNINTKQLSSFKPDLKSL